LRSRHEFALVVRYAEPAIPNARPRPATTTASHTAPAFPPQRPQVTRPSPSSASNKVSPCPAPQIVTRPGLPKLTPITRPSLPELPPSRGGLPCPQLPPVSHTTPAFQYYRPSRGPGLPQLQPITNPQPLVSLPTFAPTTASRGPRHSPTAASELHGPAPPTSASHTARPSPTTAGHTAPGLSTGSNDEAPLCPAPQLVAGPRPSPTTTTAPGHAAPTFPNYRQLNGRGFPQLVTCPSGLPQRQSYESCALVTPPRRPSATTASHAAPAFPLLPPVTWPRSRPSFAITSHTGPAFGTSGRPKQSSKVCFKRESKAKVIFCETDKRNGLGERWRINLHAVHYAVIFSTLWDGRFGVAAPTSLKTGSPAWVICMGRGT
jgi:hypothetical protein